MARRGEARLDLVPCDLVPATIIRRQTRCRQRLGDGQYRRRMIDFGGEIAFRIPRLAVFWVG